MSDDDYYDDDSRSGGLWDPDAPSAPPPPRRRTLHAVPFPEPHEAETSSALDATSEEDTLVRLDQFRPASHDDDVGGRAGRGTWHRIVLAAATVIGIGGMLATGVPRLISGGRDPAPPAAITALGADVEQAALTRAVKSGASHHRGRAGGEDRSALRSTRARHAAKTHQGTSDAPSPPHKSTQATLVSQGAAAPTAAGGVATTASSSPAKSQRASAACEFPPC
jgi:hypothetical protein